MKARITNALLGFVFPRFRARLVELAAGELARECRADLWRQIRFSSVGMSTPEIRGYARARANVVAADHVDEVLDHLLLGQSLRAGVLATGVEELARMAVRDALREDAVAAVRPLAA
jgi:hypothetical protein